MFIDMALLPAFLICVSVLGLGLQGLLARGLTFLDKPPPAYFQLSMGLIGLGIVSIAVNFVSGVAAWPTYVLVAVGIGFGLSRLDKASTKSLLLIALSGALIAPTTTDMQPGYDGGLYHLPHQKWIRESPIVFGLANLHGRFGFGSILEHVNALFWFGDSKKLLAYVQASFTAVFISFALNCAISRRNIEASLCLLCLINLIVFGGYTGYYYTKNDVPAGLIFAISTILGIGIVVQSYADDHYVPLQRLFVFLTLCAFSIMLKPSTVTIAFWAIFVCIVAWAHKMYSVRQLVIACLIPAIAGMVWVVRGFISSGCLLYPAIVTCLDVPWSAKTRAQSDSDWITAWARHPRTDLYSLQDWSWFRNWWYPQYFELTHFFHDLGLAALGVFACLLALRFVYRSERMPTAVVIGAILFVTLSAALWFLKAPDPRFGVGVFVMTAPIIAVCVFGLPKIDRWNAVFGTALIVAVCVFAFQQSRPDQFKSDEYFSVMQFTVPHVETVPDSVFGVRPKEGDQCWLADNCAPYDRPRPVLRWGYLWFVED